MYIELFSVSLLNIKGETKINRWGKKKITEKTMYEEREIMLSDNLKQKQINKIK